MQTSKMGESQTRSLVSVFFILFFIHSATSASDFIQKSCGATQYPDLCYSSLSPYATVVQQNPVTLAVFASSTVALPKINAARSLALTLRRGSTGPLDGALRSCLEQLDSASVETKQAGLATRRLGAPKKSGPTAEDFSKAQAWLSGVLGSEEICIDGFKDVKDGSEKKAFLASIGEVKKYSANALALLNALPH